jgi:hypothetical protein
MCALSASAGHRETAEKAKICKRESANRQILQRPKSPNSDDEARNAADSLKLCHQEISMTNTTRTDADEHAIDNQALKKGQLDEDTKLDIALQGSMMTSEPPQIAEPKRAADDQPSAPADE